jgi:hypothetical protein
MHGQRRWIPQATGWLSASALSTVTLVSLPASAQPTANDAHAEALFNTAKQLQSSGQTADACELFAESKRLAPGVGVSLHLADCYEHMGQTASAWQEFDTAERLARQRGDDKRANVAQTRARALEPRLERLTLAMSFAVSHDGWEVVLDGAPIPADHWNVAMAVDPGDHTVVVQAPSQPARTLHAHLDGATNALILRLDEGSIAAPTNVAQTAAAPAPVMANAAPSPPTDPSIAREAPLPHARSGDGWRPWAEVGLVAATAAGVAFGSFFMLRRAHFIQEGPPADPVLTNQATTAATISFVASGLALTSAFVLFFTTPGPTSQAGVAIAPMAVAGGGGAIVRTSF